MKMINILIGLVIANILIFCVIVPFLVSSPSDILVTTGLVLVVATAYVDVNLLVKFWIKHNKKEATTNEEKK